MKKLFWLFAAAVVLAACENKDPNDSSIFTTDQEDFKVITTLYNQYTKDGEAMNNLVKSLGYVNYIAFNSTTYHWYREMANASVIKVYMDDVTTQRVTGVSYTAYSKGNNAGAKAQILKSATEVLKVLKIEYKFNKGTIINDDQVQISTDKWQDFHAALDKASTAVSAVWHQDNAGLIPSRISFAATYSKEDNERTMLHCFIDSPKDPE